MNLTIYHNPSCSKSREALNHLTDNGYQINVILYLKNTLNKEQLQKILVQIDMNTIQLIRKNEDDWKSIKDRNEFSENEILELLVANPKLIERPIITNKNSGVLGRPLEKLINFLKKNKP